MQKLIIEMIMKRQCVDHYLQFSVYCISPDIFALVFLNLY